MIKIGEVIISKQVVYPVLIIFLSIIIYRILKGVINKVFSIQAKYKKLNARKQKTIYGLLSNILKYSIFIIDIIVILGILGINTAALITSVGVFSLVIGLALQDTLKDVLAGIFILIENQYAVGDIIEITGFRGEVISLGLKTTKIKAKTGEIKIIPNRNIIEVINYSLNDVIVVIDINIAYETDSKKINEVIKKIVEKLSNKIEDIKAPFTFLGIKTLGDTLIYQISAPVSLVNKDKVYSDSLEEIKQILDENNIKRK
jgi:small conductance mechanosensitive channel